MLPTHAGIPSHKSQRKIDRSGRFNTKIDRPGESCGLDEVGRLGASGAHRFDFLNILLSI